MCTRPELNLMQNSINLKHEYYEIAKINSKYEGENVSIILKQFKLSEMILIKKYGLSAGYIKSTSLKMFVV